MKQKTPVQWLVEEITNKYDKSFIEFYRAEIDQALKMEHDHIIESHLNGQEQMAQFSTTGKNDYTAIQYFNDTYQTES